PPTAAVQHADGQAAPIDLESLWSALASPDQERATQAAEILVAAPKESIPFLKAHLRSVKTDAQHTAQLLADLDSPKFRVRQQATQELEYLGRYVLADLAKALKGKPNLEVAVRLDQ